LSAHELRIVQAIFTTSLLAVHTADDFDGIL